MTRMICSPHHLNNSAFGCFLLHPKGCILNAVPSEMMLIFKALAGLARFFCYAGLTDNPWRAYAFVDDAWPIALSVAGRRLRRAGNVHLADGLYKPWCA